MRWDWKAVVGIAISVLLVWWVLRGVDPMEVWLELRDANWGLLLLAVAVTTSGFLVRALRWKILLLPLYSRSRLRPRFAAVNIGFMANNLLPARGGEFARAYALSRMEPVSMSGAIGSLVVERFLDGIAIFLLLLVAVLAPSFPDAATIGGHPVLTALSWVFGLFGTLLAFLLVLLFWPRGCLRIVRAAARVLPERAGLAIVDALQRFLLGLGSLRNLRLFALGLLWSVGFWSWNAISFWLAFRAFGIDLGYAPALFVQAIIALGVAVPSAPGFFGTFHAAAVIGLHEVYGAAESATLAFAFGYHLGGFIPVTVIGLYYAWKLGISMREMGRSEEALEEAVEEEVGP